MFGVSLKAINISLQKRITFCRSIYLKKVMKLVALIFEHPSYLRLILYHVSIYICGSLITHASVAMHFFFKK